MRTFKLIACFLILATALGGCRWRNRGDDTGSDFDRMLAPGEAALVELQPADFPRFHLDAQDRAAMRVGIQHSLKYLGAPSAKQYFPLNGISQDDVRRGLERFDALLASNPSDAELDRAVRDEFRVFRSVGYDGRGSVLFTGYYTPIFDASRQTGGRYRYPLYKRPADLISGPDGKTVAQQRLAGNATRPYPDRRTLETSGVLNGSELVWLTDAFEAYVIQVQGSGRLRLPSGEIIEVGYAGTNGHEYKSIGHELINDGLLRKDQLSLDNLRDFFRRNPHLVDTYIHRNPRYVFFKEEQGGPYGSLGQPVVPDVSIATDKAIFPRAALCYVVCQLADPQPVPYAGFRLDHDTGGAIRAPGRVDLYMGVGKAAELRAGRQLAEGSLYYLIAR